MNVMSRVHWFRIIFFDEGQIPQIFLYSIMSLFLSGHESQGIHCFLKF